jgi:Family of unknown function (DUF5519)
MAVPSHPPGDSVQREVGGWPGVTVLPHRFGGVEFRLGRVELGHLHGDTLADLPFPRTIRDELVGSGRARPHHVLPDSGWVSRPIRGPDDVPEVVALFRLNYERITARSRNRPEGAEPRSAGGPGGRQHVVADGGHPGLVGGPLGEHHDGEVL